MLKSINNQICDIVPVGENLSAMQVRKPDGSIAIHARGPHNPVWFKDASHIINPIDLVHVENFVGGQGNGRRKNKNVRSVGWRLDGANLQEKLMGIRPSDRDDGGVQFEFTIESIKRNGMEILVDWAIQRDVGHIMRAFGSNDKYFIRMTRQGCRHFVKIDNQPAAHSVEITYKLHTYGLTRIGFDFFRQDTGAFFIGLREPMLVDADGELVGTVSPVLEHELADIGGGEFRYRKFSTDGFADAVLGLGNFLYVDAATVYSSTSDGYISNSGTVFSTVRGAVTGVGSSDTVSYYSVASSCYLNASTYWIIRSFFYFSISSGTYQSVAFYIKAYSYYESDICAQKGTQADTITTSDYDSFSGLSYGSKGSLVNGYNYIDFDSTGINDINTSSGSVAKVCCREYSHDYSNSQPAGNFRNGCFFADSSGTSSDPYLELTIQDFKRKVMFF